ncbi:MAG: HNH endonuclease [Colwellia sp.]|nr:HNH endonuclease [Colwellia sp.]
MFNEVEGTRNESFDDDVINLRIKCSKRENEPTNDQLKSLLSILEVSEESYLWDVKVGIWNALGIKNEPIKLKKERQSILNRSFNNAADIPILRNKEGELLLTKLGLPFSSTKRDLELGIMNYIKSNPVSNQKKALPKGNKKPESKTVEVTQYIRDKEVIKWILNNSVGTCECCQEVAPFYRNDGTFFLEVHHVRGLADSGSDTIQNTVAVCPNCHRNLHSGENRKSLKELMYSRVSRLIVE